MKRTWRLSTILCMALIFLGSINVWSDSFNYKDFSSPREFIGTVVPLTVTPVGFGLNQDFREKICYTPYLGEFFKGPTYDIQGKIVTPGKILLKASTEYILKMLEAKEALVQQAKADLAFIEADYVRNAKLVKNHSVSTHDFQQSQSSYYKSKAALAKAQSDLEETRIILDSCIYHAQFDGIVTNISRTAGLATEASTIEVTQLVPIGIKINMDRQLTNQIKTTTPIVIYPSPVVSKEPVGILHQSYRLLDDGVMLISSNYPMDPKVMENGKEIPHIHKIYNVVPFDYDMTKCAINKYAIQKDEKGYYVWWAVGQKNMIPGKAFDKVFSIKKEYIVLDNKVMTETPRNRFILLKDPGELHVRDVVVGDVPENAKDGDRVTLHMPRYLLMPGDKVKVIIGPNNN